MAERKVDSLPVTEAIAGSPQPNVGKKVVGRHWPVLQLFVLTVLLVTLGLICLKLKFWVLDLDLWVHLRVGDWIVQNHAFPHSGLFSRTAAERPWIAYSWGYELLFSRVYAWFGVMGIGIFETLMTLAVAYTVYWMVCRLSGRFWISCLLATIACAAFLVPTFALRCCSVVLFTVMLTLILEANRSGRVQPLYWLPAVFLLWSNLHIQFTYGVAVFSLFVAVNLLQRLASSLGLASDFLLQPTLPVLPLTAIFAACMLATCVGPYSYHLYQVVYGYAKAKVPYAMIIELQAPDFSRYGHYAQLLLASAAFVAVGWRKQVDLFKLVLLAVATAVAFHAVRDAWFICIPAVACIADDLAPEASGEPAETLPENLVVAAVAVAALCLLAPSVGFTPSSIDQLLRRQLPFNAVQFLQENPRQGPLYNSFDWGSFLIWHMQDYPVAIDGRTDLYGDKMVELFTLTSRGVSYQDDPYLNQSRLILLQQKNNLVRFLRADPHFELIYQDRLAAVFIRR